MRRTVLVLLSALLLLAACRKEQGSGETLCAGEETRLLCGYASDGEDRLSIAGGDGVSCPCIWNSGDAIALRIRGGKTVATGALRDGAGTPRATFSLTLKDNPGAGTPVRVVYPAESVMHFSSNTLPSEQHQTGAGTPANNISGSDFACADLVWNPDGDLPDFRLQHLLSYVRLSLSSPAFEGTTLGSVTLRCPSAALSGTYATDYDSFAITPLSAQDYVKVVFDEPLFLNAARKDIWFTLLPVDLTGKTVELSYEITTPDETFTVTTSLPGIRLEQGHAYRLDRLGFNPVPGFCPVDTRVRAGEGHAYGQANCFLIQCKDGSTYKGGTYQENPDIPSSVVIDYRVRGDRTTAVLPNGVSFGWATVDGGITDNPAAAYLPRTQEFAQCGVDPSGFSYTVDEDNYTVTVTNHGAHAGAPVLLMKKDGKVLWGWSFWNIAADGTRLTTITHNNASKFLANMDLGQPTTNLSAWVGHGNDAGTAPDPLWRMIWKFQWGRSLPLFWNSYPSLSIPGVSSGNVPAVQGPLSLAEALAHPCALIVSAQGTGSGNALLDWLDNPDGNLWGGLSTSTTFNAAKTIYDPCPKGWRVPDRHGLSYFRNNSTWAAVNTAGYMGYTSNGNPFITSGMWYDYLTAEHRIASAGGNADGNSTYGGWWTNYCSAQANRPAVLVAASSSLGSNPSFVESGSNNNSRKARAYSVRCAPDDNNR